MVQVYPGVQVAMSKNQANQTAEDQPKRTGRPPGKPGIPEWKRELMYQTWATSKNMNHVKRECGVHIMTVVKYRKLDRWDDRLEAEIAKKTGEIMLTNEGRKEGLEAARCQAIKALQLVRERALQALMKLEISKPADAWRIFTEAVKQELELRGHQKPPEVSIVVLAAQRYQAQRDGAVDITAESEVTDVDADGSDKP